MEIYIEYAFFENFLFDGTLLSLALYAAKTKLIWWRIVLSACIGGIFAILFPLLSLTNWASVLLKIAVGCLLCMLAFERLNTKKEWGRYALSCILFFCISFGFGGTLLGIYGKFNWGEERAPSLFVFLAFAFLSGCVVLLCRKLYERKRLFHCLYPCVIKNGTSFIQTQGFLDSGNLVIKCGIPVCFLSSELFYELFGEDILFKERGQGCDEIQITTISGLKIVPLYRGKLEIEGQEKDVYFSPSSNMIGREYKVLLNARILEKDYEMD